MVGLLVILFPVALLFFMLFMERVEQPLRRDAAESDVGEFLDHAQPDDVDTFLHSGLRRALDKRRRRRSLRLRPRSGARPEA